MQRLWSLYNKEEKLRIDDLTPEQVRIILLAIPTARMPDWYACQEGDIHWQPIGSIPEFYEDVRQIKGQSQPKTEEQEEAIPPVNKPVQRRPLFEEAPLDLSVTDPTLQVDSSATDERRSARRYPRKLNFKVIQGGKTFETETMDVSMNGLSLEQALPQWVPKSFRAELRLNKTNVIVLCQRVSDNQMKIMDADSWDVIRKWIVNW